LASRERQGRKLGWIVQPQAHVRAAIERAAKHYAEQFLGDNS